MSVSEVLESLPVQVTGLRLEQPASGSARAMVLVRALWESVLGGDDFEEDDDFFELGGDSIGAIRLIGALNKELDRDEHVSLIFTHPTVRELVDRLTTPEVVGGNLRGGTINF